MEVGFIEWVAFILCVLYLVLATLQSRLCWVAQGAGAAFYVALMLGAALYYEAVLNVFYIVMSIKGFIDWKSSDKVSSSIHTLTLYQHGRLISIGFLFSMGLYLVRVKSLHLDFSALADSVIFCFSIATTWLAIKRVLENWLYWIVIDALAVWIFWYKALYLTSALFLIYIILAFWGGKIWYGALLKQKQRETRSGLSSV